MMDKFIVVKDFKLERFQRKINEILGEGYELRGDMIVAQDIDGQQGDYSYRIVTSLVYHQVLVLNKGVNDDT